MYQEIVESLTQQIIDRQDENGCWHVLDDSEYPYPKLKHYVPTYKTSLWTLLLLADIECDRINSRLIKPLKIISDHFWDKKNRIFSIGKSHFPIPCLNGNMLYLLSYFQMNAEDRMSDIVDFFAEYQRFDDGDYQTPKDFPYYRNRSCYGTHTCYWGVVKLLKGLSFIPQKKRSENASVLIKKCIDFVLLHQVCYRSHDECEFMHTNIKKLTFPNMYQSDFLEILWLLKREKVKSSQLDRAIDLLKQKMGSDSTWKIERRIKDLIIPIGKRYYGYQLITRRARHVLEYYDYTWIKNRN